MNELNLTLKDAKILVASESQRQLLYFDKTLWSLVKMLQPNFPTPSKASSKSRGLKAKHAKVVANWYASTSTRGTHMLSCTNLAYLQDRAWASRPYRSQRRILWLGYYGRAAAGSGRGPGPGEPTRQTDYRSDSQEALGHEIHRRQTRRQADYWRRQFEITNGLARRIHDHGQGFDWRPSRFGPEGSARAVRKAHVVCWSDDEARNRQHRGGES